MEVIANASGKFLHVAISCGGEIHESNCEEGHAFGALFPAGRIRDPAAAAHFAGVEHRHDTLPMSASHFCPNRFR